MKTDDLVALLAAGDPAVPPHAARRRLGKALAWGLVLALIAMALTLGLRPDWKYALQLPMFWVKLGMPALLALAAMWALERLGRPGTAVAWRMVWMVVPVLVLWLLGGAVFATAPQGDRGVLLWGDTWRTCPFNIAFLAIPMLASGFWALRGLAPTRPRLAGASVGLMAGGVGAAVYALHCPEMAAPFIAVWYVLGMMMPALLGALAGARLLRW
jgi:hypothetical protein